MSFKSLFFFSTLLILFNSDIESKNVDEICNSNNQAEPSQVSSPEILQINSAPLNKVAVVYPRRAQERGTIGYALVELTIADTGSVENAKALEGVCGFDPWPCTIFNSASVRAALKFKYKPMTIDGKAVPAYDVHKFTFVLDEYRDDWEDVIDRQALKKEKAIKQAKLINMYIQKACQVAYLESNLINDLKRKNILENIRSSLKISEEDKNRCYNSYIDEESDCVDIQKSQDFEFILNYPSSYRNIFINHKNNIDFSEESLSNLLWKIYSEESEISTKPPSQLNRELQAYLEIINLIGLDKNFKIQDYLNNQIDYYSKEEAIYMAKECIANNYDCFLFN